MGSTMASSTAISPTSRCCSSSCQSSVQSSSSKYAPGGAIGRVDPVVGAAPCRCGPRVGVGPVSVWSRDFSPGGPASCILRGVGVWFVAVHVQHCASRILHRAFKASPPPSAHPRTFAVPRPALSVRRASAPSCSPSAPSRARWSSPHRHLAWRRPGGRRGRRAASSERWPC